MARTALPLHTLVTWTKAVVLDIERGLAGGDTATYASVEPQKAAIKALNQLARAISKLPVEGKSDAADAVVENSDV